MVSRNGLFRATKAFQFAALLNVTQRILMKMKTPREKKRCSGYNVSVLSEWVLYSVIHTSDEICNNRRETAIFRLTYCCEFFNWPFLRLFAITMANVLFAFSRICRSHFLCLSYRSRMHSDAVMVATALIQWIFEPALSVMLVLVAGTAALQLRRYFFFKRLSWARKSKYLIINQSEVPHKYTKETRESPCSRSSAIAVRMVVDMQKWKANAIYSCVANASEAIMLWHASWIVLYARNMNE